MYEKYLNIFYHKNYRNFLFCDCYGLCYLFNKEELGVVLPEYLHERINNNEEVNATLKSKKLEFKNVPRGKETIGDVVMLNVKGLPIHVGVVLQDGMMLHIMENKHAKIESYKSGKWNSKVESFHRYESSN